MEGTTLNIRTSRGKYKLLDPFINTAKYVRNSFRLLIDFGNDRIRFRRAAFGLNHNNDQVNLSARLSFHTHAIEKGLCNPNFRKGFGKRALSSLTKAIFEYKNKGYPYSKRFLAAIEVLRQYCIAHEYDREYTGEIEKIVNLFQTEISDLGVGAADHTRDEILQEVSLDFSHLASHRISVRDYAQDPVVKEDIFHALELAMKSPSVCNRQPWKVHLIEDEQLLHQVMTAQGGFAGNGHNMQLLLLVTVDLRYFSTSSERNQGFVDGGIYLMSLVYALTYHKMATCILNADFPRKQEKKIRSLLDLDDSEVMIGFISVGRYPEHFKSPASIRDSYLDCLKIH
jgi:hypothetical protein